MCVNKKWIFNKYDGRRYLVNCGHCEACLQEKAQRRTSRLINESPDNVADDRDRIFLTLTYDNKFIPYIRARELREFCKNPYGDNSRLNLYRDYSNRVVRCKLCDGKMAYQRKKQRLTSPIVRFKSDDFCTDRKPYFDFSRCLNEHYPGLQRKTKNGWHEISDKVGVIWTPDIQNFFKSLRNILKRKFDFNGKFTYFWTTEYGPTYGRPHAHILLFVPKGCFDIFRNAIIQAWPFSDQDKTFKQCQRAYKPSTYVSSYVNSRSFVPFLFKECRLFQMSHHGSLHYGFGHHSFSLDKMYEAIRTRDIRYDKDIYINGKPTRVNNVLPSYVISRWFPRFKGDSRLSGSALYNVVRTFGRNLQVSEELSLDDTKKIFVCLSGHYKRFIEDSIKYLKKSGVKDKDIDKFIPSSETYAQMYVDIWTIRKSNVYIDFLKLQTTGSRILESYDNTTDVEFQHLQNESIVNLLEECVNYERDPNKRVDNIIRTQQLKCQFLYNTKDRKIKSHLYHI